ncbi:MAG: zinc finger protein [Harvfovirus sp.]|uniref:Zinc finger protein n=1 Tax=Harvfovirus sp. TaxID=2487768 RepID=A0A3G5A501_9VIRU|nr:MAG: zinc finger protein [Harvfovirus sp.]
MIYKCNTCSYETDIKCNYNKHTISRKHIDAIKEEEHLRAIETKRVLDAKKELVIELNDKFICELCNTKFQQQSSLCRHKKKCGERQRIIDMYEEKLAVTKKEMDNYEQLKVKLIEIQEDLKNYEIKNQCLTFENKRLLADLEGLAKDKDSFRAIAENNSEATKVSTNALSYVMNHFKTCPPLHTFSNHKLLGDDDLTIAENAVHFHKKKESSKYIGEILVKEYKKADPKNQPLWNSDSARLAYLVRELINKEIEWCVDRGGIKTSEYLIKPVLNFIRDVVEKYVIHLGKGMNSDNDVKSLTLMENASVLIGAIDDGSLNKDILKFLAPYFHLNKKKSIKKLIMDTDSKLNLSRDTVIDETMEESYEHIDELD